MLFRCRRPFEGALRGHRGAPLRSATPDRARQPGRRPRSRRGAFSLPHPQAVAISSSGALRASARPGGHSRFWSSARTDSATTSGDTTTSCGVTRVAVTAARSSRAVIRARTVSPRGSAEHLQFYSMAGVAPLPASPFGSPGARRLTAGRAIAACGSLPDAAVRRGSAHRAAPGHEMARRGLPRPPVSGRSIRERSSAYEAE